MMLQTTPTEHINCPCLRLQRQGHSHLIHKLHGTHKEMLLRRSGGLLGLEQKMYSLIVGTAILPEKMTLKEMLL